MEKSNYRVHKFLLLNPILIQMNPVHILKLYFLKIHLNIILAPTLTPPIRHFHLSLSIKILNMFLTIPCVLHAPPFLCSLIEMLH